MATRLPETIPVAPRGVARPAPVAGSSTPVVRTAEMLKRHAHQVAETAIAYEQERRKRAEAKAIAGVQSEFNAFRERALLEEDPEALEAMFAEGGEFSALQRDLASNFSTRPNMQAAIGAISERTRASLVGHRLTIRRRDSLATADLLADTFADEVSQIPFEQGALQGDAIDQLRSTVGQLEGLTPAEREERFQRGLRLGAVAFIEKQIEDDPDRVRALLQDTERVAQDPLLSGLTEGDRELLGNKAQTERLDRAARAVSDLEIAVSRGQAAEPEIEAAFDAELISGPKRTQLVRLADSVRARAQAVFDGDRMVAEALAGLRPPLDFRDREVRKAVDRFYEQRVLPELMQNPQAAPAATADFSARIGMVPDVVQGNIRGALRAGDVQSVVMAADTLDRLHAESPALLQEFSDEDIALGQHVSKLVRAGVMPNKAVENARAAQIQSDQERAERKRRYAALNLTNDNPAVLEDFADTRLFGSSRVPDAMYGEFEMLVRDNFMRTGDEEVAQESAWRSMQRTWSETRVNGDREWMKYAPENYYGIGRDPSWIREQLLDDLSPVLDPEMDVDRLRIVPDLLTSREAAYGQPSYSVLLQNADTGEFEPLLDRNGEKIETWRPDYPTSPAAERDAEIRDQEADGFRAARALRLRSGPGPHDHLPILQGGR